MGMYKTCPDCGDNLINGKCEGCYEKKYYSVESKNRPASHRDFERVVYKKGSVEVGENHLKEIKKILGIRDKTT